MQASVFMCTHSLEAKTYAVATAFARSMRAGECGGVGGVCLGLCVSAVDRGDQMCGPHVCINTESNVYTQHAHTCSLASSSSLP